MRNLGHLPISHINLSVVFVLCLLCACSGRSAQAQTTSVYKKITAETAYQMMQKPNAFILLDVRTEQEFQEKHIAGAILIPVQELEKRAATELPDKNGVIFVYCRSGVRSSNAAKILIEKGYTQVFDIGGIIDWPYETVNGN